MADNTTPKDGYVDKSYKKIIIGGKPYDVVSDGWAGGNTVMGDDGKRHYYSYDNNTGVWSVGDISENQKKEDEKAANKAAQQAAKDSAPKEIEKTTRQGITVWKYNGAIYYTEEAAKAAKEKRENPATPNAMEGDSRYKAPVTPQKTGSNLGGRTTEQWVKDMKDAGMSDEEIAVAYEKENYSREGGKFKAAMEKYKTPEPTPDEDPSDSGSNATSEGNNENPTPTPEAPTKKGDYWTNLIYGNDWGSVNDKTTGTSAKEDKQKKAEEFMKNNPSLVKAIFGKDSGLNFGQRVARLGELLAIIGGSAVNGAYAGFNHQAIPEATKGAFNEVYKNAFKKQYERQQDVFDSENKAKIDKADRVSMLKSSPVLASELDENTLSILADHMVASPTEAEWKKIRADASAARGKDFTDDEWNDIKSAFSAATKNSERITNQKSSVVDLNGKQFDLTRKPQQAIMELRAQIKELEKQKEEVASLEFDKLPSFMKQFRDIYSGIQSTTTALSSSKNFNWDAHLSVGATAEVKSGIPIINGDVTTTATASGGAGGGSSNTASSGKSVDELALEGLGMGEYTAAEWNRKTKEYRENITKSLDYAINEAKAQIETLQEYSNKFNVIDDGIVKAPHMKQWLVREDGTKIALNPDDSIYATKNTLTSKEEKKGDEIIPMQKEDKVVVIQRKLGHCDGQKICKDFDHYLSKLR